MSTEGKTITCKAAIAWEAGKPLSVEDVEVLPPRAHEVRIKIAYTGVCHTDAYTLSGLDPEGAFPVILGHEGAGIVESVGEGVTNVKVGDHVIALYTPECGECKFCKSGKTNLCGKIRATQGNGVMPDGTSRFRARGQDILHFMGCSTFSEYTVVTDISVVAVNETAPMDRTCLLGCGITTGYGAATITANVQEGDKVAVFGAGCVGVSLLSRVPLPARPARSMSLTLMTRRRSGPRSLVPLTLSIPRASHAPSRKSWSSSLMAVLTTPLTVLVATFHVMRAALEACHKGWGQSIVIGVAASGQEISTRPFQLVTGRVWRGCAFGGVKGRSQLPGIVEDYLQGKIKVDEFITHRRHLSEINTAFEDMHSGTCIRAVLDFKQ